MRNLVFRARACSVSGEQSPNARHSRRNPKPEPETPVFVLIVRMRRSSKTNFRKMLAHLPISPRVLDFLVLTKMIAASGNEIAKGVETFELLFKFNIFE